MSKGHRLSAATAGNRHPVSVRLTWRRVRAQRVAAHSLDGPAPARELIDVVGRVCGIHAQITSAAELSIGVRVEVSREQIRAALWDKRTLVRSEERRVGTEGGARWAP